MYFASEYSEITAVQTTGTALILTTGHRADDERFIYTLSPVLAAAGYKTIILSTVSPDFFSHKGIEQHFLHIPQGQNKFVTILSALHKFKPEVIVCAEVSALIPAALYRSKGKNVTVINDITEYYPDNIVAPLKGLSGLIKQVILRLLNILTATLPDALLYTEQKKMRFYQRLFCRNRFYLPFFPSASFINGKTNNPSPGTLKLFYSANASEERGLPFFTAVLREFVTSYPNIRVELTLAGELTGEQLTSLFSDLHKNSNFWMIHYNRCSYLKYREILNEQDIALDLRIPTPFFDKSLPIKTFDFITAGVPFIATALTSYREFPELSGCGVFVASGNAQAVVSALKSLKDDTTLYRSLCENARRLASGKFNRELYEGDVINFLSSIPR